MKARYKHLLDHSTACALGAIEVYNKPAFPEREQAFSVLLVIAWEALLKAKILKDHKNRLTSLYVRSGNRYKKSRTGRYLTVELLGAAAQCSLDAVVLENLERLVDVRDAAIHLTADSPSLPYLVFSLGLASLRNYSKLLSDWFSVTMDEYNLFILPLGFAYPFKAVTPTALRREPKEIAAILRQVSKVQTEGKDESGGFHLAFELKTTLVSAKKLTGTADVLAALDQDAKGAIIVEKRTRLVDSYPLSFTDMWKRVKTQIPDVKQSELFTAIKDLKVKEDPKYSAYNWRNKAEEKRGPRPTTPVIYNEDCVTLMVAEILRRRSAA